MSRYWLYIVLGLFLITCANQAEQSSDNGEIKELRRARYKFMLGPSSPLPDAEKKNFTGLNFYPEDRNFVYDAEFTLIGRGTPVYLMTNTERKAPYLPAASIRFKHRGVEYSLIAYKDLESNEKTLFLPFNDASNGSGTYASGRYMDLEVPQGKNLRLDFNSCYNPYCAYNKRYSCPIPPRENNLSFEVLAGEKKYH